MNLITKTIVQRSGFTLVELSIVLVIIGLLVGGVVGGQSLIESQKRQSLLTSVNELKTAVHAFELQYDALPGDFAEATDYWPGKSYSGDGDWKVEKTLPSSSTYYYGREHFQGWVHLSLSGVVNRGYRLSNVPYVERVGVWSPETGYNGITTSMLYSCAPMSSCHNYIVIGSYASNDWGDFEGYSVAPRVAAYVDKKLDDGLAVSGNVISLGSKCTSSGVYDVTVEAVKLETSGHGQTFSGCGVYIKFD